jgi:hypothetical protein
MNDFCPIHDPKRPGSFNSGRWKCSYNPDLIFTSKHISTNCVKFMSDPTPKEVPFRCRFNLKKTRKMVSLKIVSWGPFYLASIVILYK